MNHYSLQHNDGTVYPGDFVPLFSEAEIKQELKLASEDEKNLPPVNIIELTDAYKIELVVPGVKKEDFCIHSEAHVLSISVMHKENNVVPQEQFRLHEFKNMYYDRHIILPDNADTAFIAADYDAGILRLFFPKLTQPINQLHTRIIVY